MSEGETAKSARAMQLVTLAAVGVTVLLKDPPEARVRLEAALTELQRWPSDPEEIGRALENQCKGVLDLPRSPQLAWFDEHREPNSTVFARCFGLEPACPAMAKLRQIVSTPVGAVEAAACNSKPTEALLQLSKPAASSDSPGDWFPVFLTNQPSSDSALESATQRSKELEADGTTLLDAIKQNQKAKQKYAGDRIDKGAAASPAESERLFDGCKTALTQALSKQTAFTNAEQSLRQGSADLRGALPSDTGSSLLLRSTGLDLLLTARVPAINEKIDRSVDSLTSCLETTRIPFGPCITAAGTSAICAWGAVPPLNFDAFTEAGIWGELRDLDLSSAQSRVRDAETKAELEAEVLGLKVNGADALRWMWLPIVSTALYGFTLSFRGSAEEKHAPDWWNSLAWQLVVMVFAAAGAAVSLAAGFGLGKTEHGEFVVKDNPLYLACVLASALLGSMFLAFAYAHACSLRKADQARQAAKAQRAAAAKQTATPASSGDEDG